MRDGKVMGSESSWSLEMLWLRPICGYLSLALRVSLLALFSTVRIGNPNCSICESSLEVSTCDYDRSHRNGLGHCLEICSWMNCSDSLNICCNNADGTLSVIPEIRFAKIVPRSSRGHGDNLFTFKPLASGFPLVIFNSHSWLDRSLSVIRLE